MKNKEEKKKTLGWVLKVAQFNSLTLQTKNLISKHIILLPKIQTPNQGRARVKAEADKEEYILLKKKKKSQKRGKKDFKNFSVYQVFDKANTLDSL